MEENNTNRPQDNEVRIALDGKRIQDLSPALQDFVESLFPKAKQSDVVKCELCDRYEKPDIRIVVGDEMHFVSLKSGRSKSIHYESIRNLVLFLRSLGVSEATQKTLLLFHYGDGTMTGKGETRLSRDDVMEKYKDRIALAMKELNKAKFLRACLKRFVFSGSELRTHSAEFLSFGDITTFLTVTKDEVFDFVMRQNYDYIRSAHIGPMLLSPWQRNLDRKEDAEWKREIVHVTWPYLLTDIQKMIKRRGH